MNRRRLLLTLVVSLGGGSVALAQGGAINRGPVRPVGPSLQTGAYLQNFTGAPLPANYRVAPYGTYGGGLYVPNAGINVPITVPSAGPSYMPIPPLITTFDTPRRSAVDALIADMNNRTAPFRAGTLAGVTAGTAAPAAPPAATVSHFTVKLPANAKLWVEQFQSTQTGPVRLYHTPSNLEPGKTYEYAFRAQWEENGQTINRERTVRFQAGERPTVDFSQN
jgi:uncharacterized protein (TIGR03000 family)